MGFTAKDISNKSYWEEAKKIECGDASTMLSTLNQRKAVDPGFFFEYETDSEGRLKCLFFADTRSLLDYSVFGDVVIFDSTFRTNRYSMPFVQFVGLNHHRKAVIFGCGIISDGTLSSFKWLLDTFLRANRYKTPLSLVTDGDIAVCIAIKTELVGSSHQLCLLHLVREIHANIHSHELIAELFELMLKKCSPEEFDCGWGEIIDKYDVVDNEWLGKLYERSRLWAEAYLSDRMFLGKKTTRHIESMNHKLRSESSDRSRLMTLVEILQHYDRCVTQMRKPEAYDNFKASQTEPFLRNDASQLEKHAAKVYTEAMFKCVHAEILRRSDYEIINTQHVSSTKTHYVVANREDRNRMYIVKFIQHTAKVMCACEKLQQYGIPCRHIFHVLDYLGETQIPEGASGRRYPCAMKTKEQVNLRMYAL